MFDLVPFEPGALGQPLQPEIDSARRYVDAAQAASTERAYRRGWGDFCAWCAFRGVEPLPAHPAAVAMYLSFLADRGRAAASIGSRTGTARPATTLQRPTRSYRTRSAASAAPSARHPGANQPPPPTASGRCWTRARTP